MRDEIKIRENAKRICDNLSPLVGTKLSEKEWSPRTSKKATEDLDIAYTLCTNLDEARATRGELEYEFSNKVNIRASNIYKLARAYSSVVVSPNYTLQAQVNRHNPMDASELIYLQSLNPNYNNSAIIDIFEEDKSMKLCPVYKHTMLIVLECFALRWALYEYAVDGLNLKEAEVATRHIDKIANNIEYVKNELEKWDSQKAINLNHHLTTLLLNVLAVKKDVTSFYLEVE